MQSTTTQSSGPKHIGAIDLAKGIAIVGVLAIHAPLFPETRFFDAFIARSVPIFLLLLGVTGELWHRRAPKTAVRDWYRARLPRLLLPFWVALTLWWIGASSLGANLPPLDLRILLGLALGQVHWAPIFWFVPVAAQWILLFPALRWALETFGDGKVLLASLAITVASVLCSEDIITFMIATSIAPAPVNDAGFWKVLYFLLFGPAFALHVTAGAVIARRGLPLKPQLGWACLVAYLLASARLSGANLDSLAEVTVQRSIDPLLGVALIALSPLLTAAKVIASPLAWLGRHSWYVYLGHGWAHSIVGLVAPSIVLGAPPSTRVPYFFALLALGSTAGLLEAYVTRPSSPKSESLS